MSFWGGCLRGDTLSTTASNKRGEGQQRDRHGRRRTGGAWGRSTRQAREGSGSTRRFITYYMETIFRAEPWWRARNRDGAFAGPGPWGPRSVFTLGIGCTLTYPTCMPGLLHYTMRLGSGRPGLGGGGGGCGGGGAEGAGLGLRATTLLCSLTAAPDYQDGPRVQEPGELGELGRDHRDKAAAQEALRW